MKKRRVIFRIFPFNRLTIPLLLNIWEKEGIDNSLEIILSETIPEPRRGDTILYSFMTPHLPIIHREIEELKKYDVIFAAGGPHVTGDTELSEKIGFNILIPGEAENSFIDFGYDLIKGDLNKSSFKIYSTNKKVDFKKNIPVSKYMKLISPLEITRGCLWNCRYCETGSIPFGNRSMESINIYLEELKKRDFKRVGFIAPSSLEFGAEKPGKTHIEIIEKLLRLTNNKKFKFIDFGIFPSEIRPESFNDRFASVIKKYASNKYLTFGAQSGSKERLRELKRGNNIGDIENAVEIANRNGFISNLDFILGFPDETKEEREITFEFINNFKKKYSIRVQFHHFFPLAGSYYQFRFPSELTAGEITYLDKMKKDGTSTSWWSDNENGVDMFFEWMKSNFPEYYEKFH